MRAGLFVCIGLYAVLLGGCSLFAPQYVELRRALPPGLPLSTDLADTPYFPQTEHYCGPAALAMVLNHAGAKVTQPQLINEVFLPGRQGTLQVEMLAAARRHGMVAYVLEPMLGNVLLEIAAGSPVISLENHGVPMFPTWHYAVAIGFDIARGEILRHSGERPRSTQPLPVFEHFWAKAGRWAMVATPPDRVPVTATEPRYAEAVVALEKAGQPQRAALAYDAMLKRWPTSLVAWMGRGNAAHARGDLATAEAAFREAVRHHPQAAAAHNNLAQTLLDLGRIDAARAAAEQAVKLGGPLAARAQETLAAIAAMRKKQGVP